MGLTKQYYRYTPAGNLNIINNINCNVVFVTLADQEGRFVAVGACEHVYIWDLKLGEKAQVLSGENYDVTHLTSSPDKRHIAVGYADGSIKIFHLRSAENISIFIGHKSDITTLAYDQLGHRMASGSKDCDIIVWDVIAETGICRLSAHKGAITQVSFMNEYNILISSSKDTFVKFWDLDTEHNFKTLTGHRSEVWAFTLIKNDEYLITGCNDSDLRIWKISFTYEDSSRTLPNLDLLNIDNGQNDIIDTKYPLRCEKIGSVLRAGRGRIVSLISDPTHSVFACHGAEKTVELFYMIPENEVKEKLAKRINKEKKQLIKEGKNPNNVSQVISLQNEIRRLQALKVSNIAKSIDLVMSKNGEVRVCTGLSNNSLELYSLSAVNKESESHCLRTIKSHGHRSDVRAVCFSSDNLAFATASGDSIKLWNRPSLACLRTVECGYALSIVFVPGDRHLIVGMKDGKLLVVDIVSGTILEEVPAHNQELWSIVIFPDVKGVATGSSDKTVKFWNFELIEESDSESKSKVLSLLHTRTLTLDEAVLCIKISSNNRFIAVSLLDSTVKIFYVDTLKFFISLYGHKMPVLCMDISSDSTLIATGSADRNVKIWGMDFGDCHKSLFAHEDSVMGICFIPKTHLFSTCGKDGKLKLWDADIFKKITTFRGHSGESWCCAVSPNGVYIASAGSDKVIRLYEKSSELLVLEDETEEEREKQENELVTGETTTVSGLKQQSLPSRKTVNTEKAAELILECLETLKIYTEECDQVIPPNAPPPLPPIMQALNCQTSEDYLIETFKRIRASDVEETLLLLPYSAACEILQFLPKLLRCSTQIEILSNVALHLIKAHHGPISANTTLLPILEEVRTLTIRKMTDLRDTIGHNLYGMMFMQQKLEEHENVHLFRDATKARKTANKKRKNKERALKRAILTI